MESQEELVKSDALELTQTVTTSLVRSEARLKLKVDSYNSPEPTVVSIDIKSGVTSEHLKAVQHEVNAWITAQITEKQ